MMMMQQPPCVAVKGGAWRAAKHHPARANNSLTHHTKAAPAPAPSFSTSSLRRQGIWAGAMMINVARRHFRAAAAAAHSGPWGTNINSRVTISDQIESVPAACNVSHAAQQLAHQRIQSQSLHTLDFMHVRTGGLTFHARHAPIWIVSFSQGVGLRSTYTEIQSLKP